MADLSGELYGSGNQQSQQPAAQAPSQIGTFDLAKTIMGIPRALGIGSRAVIQGAGDTADFLASPVRGAVNAVLPNNAQINPGIGNALSNLLGLPSPQNAPERIAFEGAKLGTGALLPAGLAGQAAKAGKVAGAPQSVTNSVLDMLAAKPVSQAASGAAAGLLGQDVKEEGGSPGAQTLAALIGGLAAPAAIGKGQQLMDFGGAIKNRLFQQPQNQQQIDIAISNALKNSDISAADIAPNVMNSIRNDVGQALKVSDNLSPDAIRRLADYRLTGATPTNGSLTLNPVTVTQEKNLAKLGANSKDTAAQQLANLQNANNGRLITNLNDLGATAGAESEVAGSNLKGFLSDYAAKQKGDISGLYNQARNSEGRAAQLDSSAFTQNLGDSLSQANLEAFLPSEIRSMVNGFASGKIPLNVNTSEQFKTIVGNAQRASNDGNVRTALGIVRDSLDNTPLIGNQANFGQEAVNAFTQARAANRSFMQTVEKTPALSAALEDASPKGFFDKFVINGDSKGLASMVDLLDPGAVQSIRNQVIANLKTKALNGAADEIGKFSQSSYNKALGALGTDKLKLLFSPEELNQLKAVGRVASYESVQPVGSAVNNSNTASAGAGLLERLGNSSLLSKIPLGSMIAQPAQNISIGIRSGQALNAPQALIGPQVQQPRPLAFNPILPLLLGQQSN